MSAATALRLVAYGVAGAASVALLARGVAAALGRRGAEPKAAKAPAKPAPFPSSVYRTAEAAVALHPAGWIAVPGVGEVTARPLASTEGAGVDYARGTADDAERWAEKFGAALPSPAELDAYAAHVVATWGASHRLAPVLLVQSADDAKTMATRAAAVRHDERVRAQIAEREIADRDPVINIGKHWADDPQAPAGKATNHGWWRDGKPPIQNAGHAHNGSHVDYSQTVLLVRRGGAAA